MTHSRPPSFFNFTHAHPSKPTTGNNCTGNSREALLALLALQQVDGLGAVGLNHLLASQTTVLQLLELGPNARQLEFLSAPVRRRLTGIFRSPRSSVYWQIAEQTLGWLDTHGGLALTKDDSRFPPLLRELADCPPLLFVHGQTDLLISNGISIVGTRKPSITGRQFAQRLARNLAEAGLVVTSGMALGIDTATHQGALDSSGRTVAVMATGLDVMYPASNFQLSQRIKHSGALVTEMPLGTSAHPGLFPRRNRIVAALSLGVVVVEAGLPSGSLITANFAAEQGREVFAVPGAINNSQSKGCHQLIRDGAHLIESAEDVLAVLGGFRSLSLPANAADNCADSPELDSSALSPELRRVLAVIQSDSASFEMVSRGCGLAADQLNMALVDLELLGFIVAVGGQYSLKI